MRQAKKHDAPRVVCRPRRSASGKGGRAWLCQLGDLVKRWTRPPQGTGVYTRQGIQKLVRAADFPAPAITDGAGRVKLWQRRRISTALKISASRGDRRRRQMDEDTQGRTPRPVCPPPERGTPPPDV